MEDRGKWIEIPDTPDIEEKVKEMGAARVTALATSEAITDETDNETVKYKGPLYFDIDAGDLNVAIDSTRELVGKLQQLDVPDEAIKVYCSGKKGFHVFVPEKVFMESQRAVRKLPAVYMEVAKDLYVHGMDFAVYSGGKGRMFRPENSLRPDGAYRVRISLDELKAITPDSYKEMVAGPRDVEYKQVNGAKAYSLAALFERAKTTVYKKQALRDSALPIEDLKPYAEDPPACIPALIQTSKDVHFNQAGMQLSAFIARAGVPQYKAQSLIDELSSKKESTTYDSFKKRKIHLEGLVKYTSAKQNVQFSCAAMRSLVTKKPCRDCPLSSKGLGNRGAADMPAVLAKADGYYIAGRDDDRRISTFTLHPLEVIMDKSTSGGTSRRIATAMQIQSHGEILGRITFDETGWRSKAELLKQIEGIGNLGFLGTDADVQKIKIAVYAAGEDEVDEITKVHSAGIWETAVNRSGAKIYTYVEPGLSINSYGIKGTHEFHGRCDPEPALRKTTTPNPDDQWLGHTLRQLTKINSPLIMAQLIGWHSACHIKTHVMSMYDQFPSLNLWGNAGSGKTMTSSLMTCLNGVDYTTNSSPILLSMVTAYPLIEDASSTTTVPRILEEFNKSKIKKYGMYETCVEIIKAAWNNHPVSRGRLRSSKANNTSQTGAETVHMYITAPLIVCSEQASEEPALMQRMLQVELSNKTREGCTDAFMLTKRKRKYLLSFSRALTMTALKTKEDWIGERLELSYPLVPEGLNDRSRFSYALLFVGLDYYHAVAHSLNINLDKEVGMLKQALYDHLNSFEVQEELTQTKVWSEVDNVLSVLADMAQLGTQDQSLSPLVQGKHYMAVHAKDELLLDLDAIYPMFRLFARRAGHDMVFNSLKQFKPLLKSESYFVTDKRRQPEISQFRSICVLSLSKMREKGHNVALFDG